MTTFPETEWIFSTLREKIFAKKGTATTISELRLHPQRIASFYFAIFCAS
jgi:hypothetical protein